MLFLLNPVYSMTDKPFLCSPRYSRRLSRETLVFDLSVRRRYLATEDVDTAPSPCLRGRAWHSFNLFPMKIGVSFCRYTRGIRRDLDRKKAGALARLLSAKNRSSHIPSRIKGARAVFHL